MRSEIVAAEPQIDNLQDAVLPSGCLRTSSSISSPSTYSMRDVTPMSLRRDRQCNGLARQRCTIWLRLPSRYGSIRGMKKTLHIDEELLRHAKVACHASTDTDTVRLGLESLVRHAAYERLRALRGAEPRARDVPRRREQPRSRRVA